MSHISYIFWKRATSCKSKQVLKSLELTDLNVKPISQFLLPHHQAKALTKNKRHDYTRYYGFSDGMTEHHHSFQKSITSSYELHSFFRYLILKFEKLRQASTKCMETFCKSFSLPPLRTMLMSLQITPRPFCKQITEKLLTHDDKFSLVRRIFNCSHINGGISYIYFAYILNLPYKNYIVVFGFKREYFDIYFLIRFDQTKITLFSVTTG